MGQDPDTIRHEVEETRERMGETIVDTFMVVPITVLAERPR